ncbi:MAG: TetR family transcriptional regulator [Pseudonocardia sp.]|nr:TetR family transcriptional regulator [Pseudonocardia sp.]
MDAVTATRPERRRGRRPGGADTRAALLEAARLEFADRGYEGATVRRIAERAGVDAAMVNHWFGGKDALFAASIDLPISPAQIRDQVVPGDPEKLGARIIRRFLEIWDETGGGPLAALIQSVASHEEAAQMLREFIENVMILPIVTVVSPDRPDLRGALVGSQIVGLGMVRYVLRLEPLALADHASVVAAVAPNLQRYLTGPLDPPGRSASRNVV